MAEISKKQKRKARIVALQTLYSFEQSGEDKIEVILKRVEDIPETELATSDARNFARTIIRDTVKSMDSIDELLQKHMQNWKLNRVSAIDRNLLRMAIAELTESLKTPLRVVINEIIEIAKEFGTDDSAKFVNGVLDAAKQDIEYTN